MLRIQPHDTLGRVSQGERTEGSTVCAKTELGGQDVRITKASPVACRKKGHRSWAMNAVCRTRAVGRIHENETC
jgi:hypothetical protein